MNCLQIIAYIVLGILSLYCYLNNKFKMFSYFCISLLGCQLLYLFVTYINSFYPKPYQGLGYLVWSIGIIIYLSTPMIIGLIIGKLLNLSNYLLLHGSIYIMVIIVLIMGGNTFLSGQQILQTINSYYLTTCIFNLLILLYYLKPGFGIEKIIFIIVNIAIITEFITIHTISYQYFWCVNVQNIIFYLLVGWVIQRYGKIDHLFRKKHL